MDRKRIKALLDAIKFAETSNRDNVVHPETTYGVNKGLRAVGSYGLEPHTIKEMLKRNPENPYKDTLFEKDPKEIYKFIDSQNKTPELIKRSPSAEDSIAEDMAEHVIKKQKGDIPAALGSWLQGHNIPHKKMKQIIDNDEGVKDYLNRALPVYEESLEEQNEEEENQKFPKLEDLLNYKLK